MLTREVLAAAQLRCALGGGTHNATKVAVMCPAEGVSEQGVADAVPIPTVLITKIARSPHNPLIDQCNQL